MKIYSHETGSYNQEIASCRQEIPPCSGEMRPYSQEIASYTQKIGSCSKEMRPCSKEIGSYSQEKPSYTEEMTQCSKEIGICTKEIYSRNQFINACSVALFRHHRKINPLIKTVNNIHSSALSLNSFNSFKKLINDHPFKRRKSPLSSERGFRGEVFFKDSGVRPQIKNYDQSSGSQA